MKGTPVTQEALTMLPEAIVMTREASVSIYRGSPVEMVRQMAHEMKPGLSVPQAVQTLLTSIGFKRGILIAIPEDCPEDMLCALFVHALLDSGISEPVH
jgi:hypothetical protein